MSKNKNFIFLALLVISILLLTSCYFDSPANEGILKGQILVPEGTLQNKDLTWETLPDATLEVIDLATNEVLATTTADDTGYYQVFVSPGGPYLLKAAKDSVILKQVAPQVEAGIEYNLGTMDCMTTTAALIAQTMIAEGENPTDIDCNAIMADSNFDDVSDIVCTTIKAGGDPTTEAVVSQAIQDFLHPPAPTPTPLNDDKAITAFDFETFDPDVIGVIDEGAKTITLTVAFGTEVTALAPTIVHTGESLLPASGIAQDFTSPVEYTVTAEDGTTQTYLVTVTEEITIINISEISGVFAPATGAVPVTAITPTDQYTGTVTWYPADSPFQGHKIYIATITLAPKAGFALTGVSANYFSVAGAIIMANETDSGVVTAVFPESLEIGDSYGGGIIAYILKNGDPGYIAGEQHGLITATTDQGLFPGIKWITGGNTQSTWVNGEEYGGTSTDYGTGQANTDAMMAQDGFNGGAAKICDDYLVTVDSITYNDWFLPSKDELNKLYLNKFKIGGLSNNYWSSSEVNVNSAWKQNLSDGLQENLGKFFSLPVRAVRYF